MSRYFSIALFCLGTGCVGTAIANEPADECLVMQNPPALAAADQARLREPVIDQEAGGKIRRQFNFKEGDILIAQWHRCDLGIEMVYLVPTMPGDTAGWIAIAQWLDGIAGGRKDDRAKIQLAMQHALSGYSRIDVDQDGSAIELQWETLMREDMAPVDLFAGAMTYRWFGPEAAE